MLAVKEVSEHDLQRVKKDRQELARLLKQKENHPKSKKSWMDGFYFCRPKVTLVK